jgi:hypothetical protein
MAASEREEQQSMTEVDREARLYLRKLMCSPGGRDYIERTILRPFGYVMCEERRGSDVRLLDEEMGG